MCYHESTVEWEALAEELEEETAEDEEPVETEEPVPTVGDD